MSTTDTRAAFEAWMQTRPGYPFAGSFANLMWASWQAATEAAKATGTAVHKLCEIFGIKIPEGMTPEMAIACRLKDLEDAFARAARQPAPVSQDAETWLRERYGAARGHHAWRDLEEAFNAGRAALAATAAPVLSDEQREKLEYIANWMDSSVRIIQNAPDDYGPASQFDYDMGQAAHEILSILAATRSQP